MEWEENVFVSLKPVETIRLDRDRIVELGMRLGPVAAEDLISRTMEDLALLLAQVDRAYSNSDMNSVLVHAQRISDQAHHIGMTKLGRVAADVVELVASENREALAAVVARLSRLGERSIMAVWELQQNSV